MEAIKILHRSEMLVKVNRMAYIDGWKLIAGCRVLASKELLDLGLHLDRVDLIQHMYIIDSAKFMRSASLHECSIAGCSSMCIR